MSAPEFITGDDISVLITLTKDEVVFAINASATVKTRFVTANHETPLCLEVAQAHTSPGAVWGQSLIAVIIPSGITADIKQQGPALLEVQVDDGGKLTWFIPVVLIKGLIP